ncbi:MAG TPA: hypothetical protein DCL21_05305 [Alphaproteobacteria bacterium]|nr:hypothetical protein [Alphaproteobacteria bacterium]
MEKIKKSLPLVILVAIMIIASMYIDKQTILNYKYSIIQYSNENMTITGIIYLMLYFICVALSLPIATILTLLAGVIFGPILGTGIVVIGATLGALAIFLIVKNAAGDEGLLAKYKNSKSLLTLQKNIKEDAVSYMLFARLVPIFPFVLVNVAPATVGVKTSTYLWTTLIGIIPGSFVYTYLGYQSGKLEGVSDLISIEMISAMVLLGVFSLLPIFIKKIKNAKGV